MSITLPPIPSPGTNPRASWRDWLAWRLANTALWIANPWYRVLIQGAILGGLERAVNDFGLDDAEGRQG